MKNVIIMIIALACIMTVFFTAKEKDIKQSVTVSAMDTFSEITIWHKEDTDALKSASQTLLNLDNILSTTNESSEIYRINHGEAIENADAKELIDLSLTYSKKTNGYFNIAINPIVEKWGFTKKEYYVPTDDEINEILKFTDWTKIQTLQKMQIPEGMSITFGAIAKGYAADKIHRNLISHGIKTGMIDLGGNIKVFGKKPDGNHFNVAINNPLSDGNIGILNITNKSIVTSGSDRRFFIQNGIKYHHIFDPYTGKPADSGLASVTIIADDCTKADAYSTALFVMGIEKAIDFWREEQDFDVIFVTTSSDVFFTEGISDVFTINEGFVWEIIK